MKTFLKSKLLVAFFLASALFGPTHAFAHTTRSRPIEATVQAVSLETRMVTIAPATGKGPTVFALTRQTIFLHNWRFTAAKELKPGTRAVVYYRSPFFGKPFVTKIVWSNGD